MEKLLFSWLSGQWQCVIIDCKDVFSLEIIHPVANALLQFLDIRPSYHLKTIVILIKDVECDIPLNFMQSYRLKEPILVSNKSNISSTLQMKLPHQNSSLSSGNCVDKLVRRIQHGKYLPSGISLIVFWFDFLLVDQLHERI